MFKLDKVVETISHPWHYDSLFIKVKQTSEKIYCNIIRGEGNTVAKIEFNKTKEPIKDLINIINSISTYRMKNNCLRIRVFIENYDQLSLSLDEEMQIRVQKLDDKLVEFFDLSKMSDVIKDFKTVKEILENDK